MHVHVLHVHLCSLISMSFVRLRNRFLGSLPGNQSPLSLTPSMQLALSLPTKTWPYLLQAAAPKHQGHPPSSTRDSNPSAFEVSSHRSPLSMRDRWHHQDQPLVVNSSLLEGRPPLSIVPPSLSLQSRPSAVSPRPNHQGEESQSHR